MPSIAEFLAAEHRQCDDHFAAAEESAHAADLTGCRIHFQQFQAAMERHFRNEEDVLFPAFEQATSSTMGPTRVMRLEHRQIRDALADMSSALTGSDLEEYLGQAETLLILTQQHNIKEEQILYPMCDQMLGNTAGLMIQAMQDLPA
ncbi:MAG TPA: hemerythrin domain-containing protein [Candidatus Contendobacter sp.]|nr:hemerythrin domain-containing protein [Candidatus Contendobacter sp.]